MPSGTVTLSGKAINGSGNPKVGLVVSLYEAATWEAAGAATTTDTTDDDGLFSFTGLDITKTWIPVVVDGTKKTLVDARNQIQLTNIDIIDDISVDTIYEHTTGAGVTIDGVLLKDGVVAGSIANVVEDTTPQLGGNLDMQANKLVGNGGSTGIAISADGEVTMAAQPAFLAQNSAQDDNATGDGTSLTVEFDTEIFDQNADYNNTTDTFTAPVTGRYQLSATIELVGITTAELRAEVIITTSNRTYTIRQSVGSVTGTYHVGISMLCDMDASDTAYITCAVYDGTKVVDIGTASQFSGILAA